MQFNQPDTIVQDPFDPRAFNRYSYTFYNPVNLSDPSGQIAQNEQNKAYRILVRLRNWGVDVDVDWGFGQGRWVEGLWTLDELEIVLQGVRDLGKAMGGQENFKRNLGPVTFDQQSLRPGLGGLGGKGRVTLNHNSNFSTWTIVHELAHAWDANFGWQLSEGMATAMGASFPERPSRSGCKNPEDCWYDPGLGPPPAGVDGNFNAREDFAESVAAYVYPQEAWNTAVRRRWPYDDPGRGYSYSHFHDTPRGQYIAALMASGSP